MAFSAFLENYHLSNYFLPGFALVALIYGTHKYVIEKLIYRLPPGPMPLPFIGSLWYIGLKMGAKGFVGALQRVGKAYGPIFTCYVGPHRMIVLDDTAVIREAMEREQGKIFANRYEPQMIAGLEVIGRGLIFSSGELWRTNRRFVLKAMRDFGMGKDLMVSKIYDEIGPLLANLDAIDGKEFNPRPYLVNSVLNIICSLVLGKRYESPEDPEFKHLLEVMETGANVEMVESGVMIMFPFLAKFKKPRMAVTFDIVNQAMTKQVSQAIDEHRRDFDPHNIRGFPDLFIQAEKQGEPVEIADFVNIMNDLFGAGSETTSTALTWTLLYLTKFPEIQHKCQAEIDRVIESDRYPKLTDRASLIYVEAFMNEIQRHVSIASLAPSHCNNEVPTKIAGYDIPPYTMLMYNLDSIHHDLTYWKNPDDFNPDRWIGEDGKLLPHSSHFLPFGIGPRVCLGEGLARVEFFIFLVSLLHRYNFELVTKDVKFEDGSYGIVHLCPAYKITAVRR